jgi:hypothetical protein
VEALRPVTSSVEAWQVEPDTASASLKRHFGVSSLDGFGLQGRGDAVRAASAILAYVQAMQPSALSLLTRLHGYTSGEFMTLDEATRRNLELTETMRGGDAHGSLLGVLDDTRTPMGGRLLRRWLNQPLLDVNAINQRLDAVQLLHDDTVLRLDVREHCCATLATSNAGPIASCRARPSRATWSGCARRCGWRRSLEERMIGSVGSLGGAWVSGRNDATPPSHPPISNLSISHPLSPPCPKSSPSSNPRSPTSRRPAWRRRG